MYFSPNFRSFVTLSKLTAYQWRPKHCWNKTKKERITDFDHVVTEIRKAKNGKKGILLEISKLASRMRLILRRLHVRSEVGVSWSIWRNAGTKLNIAKAIQLYTAPVQAKETTKNSWVEASFAYMKKLICWRVFSSQNRSRTKRTRWFKTPAPSQGK